MATWKRILIEDDITGTDPISVVDGVVSIVQPSSVLDELTDGSVASGYSLDDEILVYDESAGVWKYLTFDVFFGILASYIATQQINAGGSTTVFSPGGVPGDLNGDGFFTTADLLLLFTLYGTQAVDQAEASYSYSNATEAYTSFAAATASTPSLLNISTAGTASSIIITVTVNSSTDIITLSGIPTVAASIQPLELILDFQVFAATSAIWSITATADVTYADTSTATIEFTPTGTAGNIVQVNAGSTQGTPANLSNYSFLIPANSLINSAIEPPTAIEVSVAATLTFAGTATGSTMHGIRIKNLNLNYI